MKVYTIREAARETKIGMEALKRACEERLINATALSNGQWRIAESALQEALHKGIDLRSLPKKASKKSKQSEALRKAQEEMKKTKGKVAAASTKNENTKKTKKQVLRQTKYICFQKPLYGIYKPEKLACEAWGYYIPL